MISKLLALLGTKHRPAEAEEMELIEVDRKEILRHSLRRRIEAQGAVFFSRPSCYLPTLDVYARGLDVNAFGQSVVVFQSGHKRPLKRLKLPDIKSLATHMGLYIKK